MKLPSAPRGFTLIELMIVVAIIGILSSIGFAEFQKSTYRTRSAERRNIMTAISHAMSDYMVTTSVATPAMAAAWNPPGTASTAKRHFDPVLDAYWTVLSRSLHIEGDTYYSYQFILNPAGVFTYSDGSTFHGARLDVYASGDLDGDGVPSDKQIVSLGFGNAFAEEVEIPEAGSEDQGTF